MFSQSSELESVGNLLVSALAELRDNWRFVAAYLAVLVGVSLIAEHGPALLGWLASIARPFVCVAGSYLLLEAMIRPEGNPAPSNARRYFSLAGLMVLILVGVIAGLNLLIVPGIVLMARWVAAPTLLIGGPQGVFESLGNSWAATRGKTTHLALATMLALFVPLAGTIGLDSVQISEETETTAKWLLFHVACILLAGLSVSLWRNLADAAPTIQPTIRSA